MNAATISGKQMKRLQTLWTLFWKHVAKGQSLEGHVGPAFIRITERSARLAWIGGQLGRQLGTCKDLSRQEAEKAIDALQAHLPKEYVRRRPGRGYARDLGTAGRRGVNARTVRPPDPGQLARIEQLKAELGWSKERFEAWLRSQHGPLRGRAQIRTMGDANAVAWGMKRILKEQRATEEASRPELARVSEASAT